MTSSPTTLSQVFEPWDVEPTVIVESLSDLERSIAGR